MNPIPVPTLPVGAAPPGNTDSTVIALVGLAHGCSHFFHMLLPPLFLAFSRDFGLSFAQLGFLVSVFFLVSGVGQALAGFLVDRVGARPVLFTAMGLFAVAAVATSTAQGYAGLVLAAALAGLGNAPFHPADFTILNQRVSQPRLGHAFSVHAVCGTLGWALAPVVVLGLADALGSWRAASLAVALVPLAVLALLVLNRHHLDDRRGALAPAPVSAALAKPGAPAVPEHLLAFLKLPAVWLCFSFFLCTSAALTAVQSFAGPALMQLHGLTVATAATVVTGYLLCSAAGALTGGFLVARQLPLERNIGLALTVSAALFLVVALGWLPGLVAGVAVALAGFSTGLAGPSRDMLIKRAAPAGATGRVYGTVYSGVDLGFALAAPVFGALMDRQWPSAVFVGAGVSMAAGVVLAMWVARETRRARAAQNLLTKASVTA